MSSAQPASLGEIFARNIPPACVEGPGTAFIGQIRGHAPLLASPVQFASYWRRALPLFYLSCGVDALSFEADHPAVRWLMDLWALSMDLLHALSGTPFPGSLGPYGTFVDDPTSTVATLVREAAMGPLLQAISEYLRPAVPPQVVAQPRPRVVLRPPAQQPALPPPPAPRGAPQVPASARAPPEQRAPAPAHPPSRYVLIRHARLPLPVRQARGLTPAQATELNQLIHSALTAYGFPPLPRRTNVEVLRQSGDIRLTFATVDLARAFMGDEQRRVPTAPRAPAPSRPRGQVAAVYCAEPDPLVAVIRSMLTLTTAAARDDHRPASPESAARARRRRRARSRHRSRRASPASSEAPLRPNEAGSQGLTPADPVAPDASAPGAPQPPQPPPTPSCTINELLDLDLGQATQRSRTASERSPPTSPETAARPTKRATPTPLESAPPTPVPLPPSSYAAILRRPAPSPSRRPASAAPASSPPTLALPPASGTSSGAEASP